MHTIVWAFFAGCVLAIPVAAWYGERRAAAWLIAIVFVEVMVLVLNKWRCPLTAVAARHTEDRRANFDIYLPEWLARHNKLIFGVLYLVGIVFAVVDWAHAGEIKLESGGTLTVSETGYSRILPHAFHDQALDSLPRLYPERVLLASRRFGVVGEVVYSLVCYKETPSSDSVVIQAVAVHRDRAWSLDTVAPPAYGSALAEVLEEIGKLSSDRR